MVKKGFRHLHEPPRFSRIVGPKLVSLTKLRGRPADIVLPGIEEVSRTAKVGLVVRPDVLAHLRYGSTPTGSSQGVENPGHEVVTAGHQQAPETGPCNPTVWAGCAK